MAAFDPQLCHGDSRKIAGAVTVPEPIPFHDQKSPETELELAGRILKPGEDIRTLPQGPYLYLIANTTGVPGEDIVIVERRVPVAVEAQASATGTIPETYLATHRGLLRQLSESLNMPVEEVRKFIVGAGQVVPLNNKINRIDNKSGTLRGDTISFEYSEDVLARYGVVTDSGTRRYDISTAPIDPVTNEKQVPDHAKDEVVAAAVMANITDPNISAVRTDLLEVQTALYGHFPNLSENKAGGVDSIQVLEAFSKYEESVMAALPKEFRDEAAYRGESFFVVSLLQTWQSESLDLSIHAMRSNYPHTRTPLLGPGESPAKGGLHEKLRRIHAYMTALNQVMSSQTDATLSQAVGGN